MNGTAEPIEIDGAASADDDVAGVPKENVGPPAGAALSKDAGNLKPDVAAGLASAASSFLHSE